VADILTSTATLGKCVVKVKAFYWILFFKPNIYYNANFSLQEILPPNRGAAICATVFD
jgi:hypothetical protein